MNPRVEDFQAERLQKDGFTGSTIDVLLPCANGLRSVSVAKTISIRDLNKLIDKDIHERN
ncbi:MAG: hypothetical protein AAF915_26105 [Cyanobacteria bacterium P01_D01_bin.50]